MRRILNGLPIAVVVAGTVLLAYQIAEHRKVSKKPVAEIAQVQKVPEGRMPGSENLPEKDRLMADRVFSAPETLDADSAASVSNTGAVEAVSHTQPMSEILPVQPPEEGLRDTETNPPYFHNDFASLRTDAVRNPDSPENRATVNALMLKRQQRLAKESL